MARKKSTKFISLEVHTALSNAELRKIESVLLHSGAALVVTKRKERDTVEHAITQVQVAKADD